MDESREVDESRLSRRDWAGLAGCVLLAAFLLTRRRVPLLSLVDLGFHELGHLLTFPLPDLWTAAAGSVAQVAVPAGLAVYFLVSQHDRVGAGLCLSWAATSAENAAVYVADAPYERLQLIGGDHDWAFILHELDAMHRAAGLAAGVRVVSWMLLAAGLAVILARPSRGLWRHVVEAAAHRRKASSSGPTWEPHS